MRRRVSEIDDVASSERDDMSAAAYSTEHLFEQDSEYHKANRSRGQNRPLCLIVQAIPFIFFHPAKRALACK